MLGVVFWLIAWPTGDWPALLRMLAALAALLALHAAVFTSAPLLGSVRRKLSRWWSKRLASLRQAVRQSRALPAELAAKVFGLGMLTHGRGVIVYGLAATSLGLDLSIATIAWTRPAALLIAILPISIAGLGVRESAMVVLQASYGIDATDALSYSLLAFATTVLAMGLMRGLLEAVRPLR